MEETTKLDRGCVYVVLGVRALLSLQAARDARYGGGLELTFLRLLTSIV